MNGKRFLSLLVLVCLLVQQLYSYTPESAPESSEKKSTSLKDELKQLVGDLRKYKATLINTQQELETSQKKLLDFQMRLDSLQTRLLERQEESIALSKDLSEALSSLNQLQRELDDLKNSLPGLSLKELRTKILIGAGSAIIGFVAGIVTVVIIRGAQ